MSVADSHRAGRVVRTGLAFAWLVATASACGSINSASDGGTGTGGSNATGAAGSMGAAGTTGAGGTTGVAGAIGSGGSTGSAGRTGAAARTASWHSSSVIAPARLASAWRWAPKHAMFADSF